VSDVEEASTRAHHDEWAWVVAAVTRHFGDLDIAEEAYAHLVQDTEDLGSLAVNGALAGAWRNRAPSKACDA